jgi:TPP-dependent pyruvate/acetoin dehydrogenase alpha subunit
LEDGDWLAPSARDLGALLVRGVEPREILLQYMAGAGSPCAGKDDANHFTDRERGILGPIGPLGTQLCVLNGIALSFKKSGERRVCVTYQGDGETRTGASHEGLAFAAALRLPMVVVIEYNGWAFATRSDREAAVREWTDVARGYGVPAIQADGNDVIAVFEAAREAIARARSGLGLTLIVAETYRMLGHSQRDPQDYVPPQELKEWRARDPIERFELHLLDRHETAEGLAEIRRVIGAKLDQAVEKALSEPLPEPESACAAVYASPAAEAPPWTRRVPLGYEDVTTDIVPASIDFTRSP